MRVPTVCALYTVQQDLNSLNLRDLYCELGQRGFANGIEIPYINSLFPPLTSLEEFASILADNGFTHSVVTPIPGTMQRVQSDPDFGLASSDADGRERAMRFMRGVLREVKALNDCAGARLIAGVFVHSAPSDRANRDAFARSIKELSQACASIFEGETAPSLIIEHCDAAGGAGAGEKRFLSIEEELSVARECGVKVTINWGRSATERHDASAPEGHIAAARSEGVLGGVMFSGAGPEANSYGGEWADAHLPHASNEPTSLMDDAAIQRCVTAAYDSATYLGVKVQCASGLSVSERIDTIERVARELPTC